MIRFSKVLALISVLLLFSFAHAETDTPVQAKLHMEHSSIQPGNPFWAAVTLELEDGWHAYWKNPGATGYASQIEWEIPDGFQIISVHWPKPERKETHEGISYLYQESFSLLVLILPPKELPEQEIQIKAHLNWLACSDTSCLPGSQSIDLSALVKHGDPELHPPSKPIFAAARESVPNQSRIGEASSASDGSIDLEIAEKLPVFAEAYFYPHDVGLLDDSKPLHVHQNEEGTLSFAIPVIEGSEPSKKLDGVLVLKDEKGEHVEAMQLEIPIQSASLGVGNFSGGVFLAIGFAFLGGLILNLMPCVLPVITLKIFSFVKMAGENRRKIMQHGLFFTGGVLVSFWALAGALMILKSYGQSAGWGFQLQEPLFVGFLAGFIFLFALSLFGVFEFGTMFSSWAGQKESDVNRANGGLSAAFFSGVLASAVATPCTGPFLGPAVGFAVTLPAYQTLAIFSSMALGMSLPYLLISFFPSLIRFLPKPGNWMIAFKEFLGFCMLATALWLAWVFGAETSTMGIFSLLFGFLAFGFGAWVYGKWGAPFKPRGVRSIAYLAAFASIAYGSHMIYSAATASDEYGEEIAMNDTPRKDHGWESFDAKRLEELKKSGKPIFIDFTAKWCLTCQVNHIALNAPKVAKKFEELGAVKILADWTKKDKAIAAELEKFGRNSVPLYVYYDGNPKHEPVILPQNLTPDLILEYLK